MNPVSAILLSALFTWTTPTQEQLAEGWIALFDGETLYGWNGEENWTVADGLLVGKPGARLVHGTRFGKVLLACQRKVGDDWKWETVQVEGEITLADGTYRSVFLKPLGLKKLFNGKNLDGWKEYSSADFDTFQAVFRVDEASGRLIVENGPGMLETKESYADFVLQATVYTAAENLNSGIFFRCIPGEKMNGYESQIHNGTVEGDRTKPLDAGTGAIFRRTTARYVPANDRELFYKTIVAVGPHFSVWVNGLQVTDWTDQRKPNPNPRRGLRLEAGTLMLQAHDATTNVFFQNLELGEIGK